MINAPQIDIVFQFTCKTYLATVHPCLHFHHKLQEECESAPPDKGWISKTEKEYIKCRFS